MKFDTTAPFSLGLLKNRIAQERDQGALIYIKRSTNKKPLNFHVDGTTARSGNWPNCLDSGQFSWMLIYHRLGPKAGNVWTGDLVKTERRTDDGRYVFHLSNVRGPLSVAQSVSELVEMRAPQRNPVYLSGPKTKGSKAQASVKADLSGDDQLANDLTTILAQAKNVKTEVEQQILARLGQGKFRRGVLKLWGGACAVTGCTTLETIRASHIRPWRDSDYSTRLSGQNGLPLIANLDALFDCGLISFTDAGEMLVSKHLNKNQFSLFGIPKGLRQPPNDDQKKFLDYHRQLHKFEPASKSAKT